MLQVRDAWAWEAVRPHEPAGEHWLSADGCEHALPRGCAVDRDSVDWIGPSSLNCGERGRFLWSRAGLAPIPYFRDWLGESIADGRGGLWRPAGVESPEGPRVARASLDDGRMWAGPVVPYEGTNDLSSHGWYLHDSGPAAPRVIAYDLTSGRSWQLPGAQLDPSGALRVGAAWTSSTSTAAARSSSTTPPSPPAAAPSCRRARPPAGRCAAPTTARSASTSELRLRDMSRRTCPSLSDCPIPLAQNATCGCCRWTALTSTSDRLPLVRPRRGRPAQPRQARSLGRTSPAEPGGRCLNS
jgi:hypothetical protein